MSFVTESRGFGRPSPWELLNRTDYRVAISEEDRDAIFRLRYDAYLAHAGIPPDFSRRLSDRYDDLDNTTIFSVIVDDELAATIRVGVCTIDYPEVPAMEVFPDIIEPEIKAGKVIVDPTRFAVRPEASHLTDLGPFITTRVAWMVAGHYEADIMLAAVRQEHCAFYRRTMNFELVAGPRYYPTLKQPQYLMACDHNNVRAAVLARRPILGSSVFEQRMLVGVGAELQVSQIGAEATTNVGTANKESVPGGEPRQRLA